MKTIEECLKILPETLTLTPELYAQIWINNYNYSYEEFLQEIQNESYFETAYIAITTNSARYKIRSNDYTHWDDLVRFTGDPVECCNKLVDWYHEHFT